MDIGKAELTQNTVHLIDYFDDIFKCNICLDRFEEPRMCFHCSKLYCFKCISSWLATETADEKCPNCKSCLKDKLVVIRWQEDLKNIHFIRQEGKNDMEIGNCSLHDKELKLFCITCQKSSCSECIDLPKHDSHLFKPINSMFRECFMPLKTNEAKINVCIEEINEITKKLNQQKVEIETTKLQALNKLNSFKEKEVADALAKIDAKYMPHICIINEQKNRIMKQLRTKEVELTKLLNDYKIMNQTICNVMKLPKFELVEKQAVLMSGITSTLSTREIVKHDFVVNTLIYDLKILFEVNISKITTDLLCSPIKQDFMENKWNIKVTKNLKDGEFISCYINLLEFKKKLKTKVKLMIISNDGKSFIENKFDHIFDKESTRGYPQFTTWEKVKKFAPNNMLKIEGYVSVIKEDDS